MPLGVPSVSSVCLIIKSRRMLKIRGVRPHPYLTPLCTACSSTAGFLVGDVAIGITVKFFYEVYNF